MKKNKILWIIFYSVFILIFNITFFVLGGIEHGTATWISYSFIHMSYLLIIITNTARQIINISYKKI